MNEAEISKFLDPHLRILRSICSGAGDREISEGLNALSVITAKFDYPAVAACAELAKRDLRRALTLTAFDAKQRSAERGAQYFLDRGLITIIQCERADG